MHCSGSPFGEAAQCSSSEGIRIFNALAHTVHQRRAGLFFNRSARESGPACALLLILLLPGVQSPPVRPPDMRHANALAQSGHLSRGAFPAQSSKCFCTEKPPHFALPCLGTEICKHSLSKVLWHN